MISPKLEIVKASAGSGKTFLLTSKYLSLLFMGEKKYREILAVTFTNKATEEMKQRILEELKVLALGEKSAYLSHILKANNWEDTVENQKIIHQKAKEIYTQILHDFSRFSVTTIDSFVQKVIRSFSYEIGLDAGYKLEMNTQKVKESLAEMMFEQLESDENLRKWVMEIAMNRLEDGRSWDFTEEMLKLADEIFKEKFFSFESVLKDTQNADETFAKLLESVKLSIQDFQSKMSLLAEKSLQILKNEGLEADDFPYKKTSFVNNFNKIAAKKYELSARFLEALNNLDKWYGKTTDAAAKSKIETIYSSLNDCMNEIVTLYEKDFSTYVSAQAILKNLYNLNLLRVLADKLSIYRNQNNILLMSDTTNLLRVLVEGNDAPFIYEKIGAKYQHFLLDEFQDTSKFQWDNFRPLIENSLAEGNYNLIVGDVKQAIYRWRNGEWKLLLQKVKEDIGENLVIENELDANYRSHKNVIHFNNFLFHFAPQLLQNSFNGELEKANPEINKRLLAQHFDSIIKAAYKDSFQNAPSKAKEGGRVKVKFFEVEDARDKRKKWRENALAAMPNDIENLLKNGYKASDICILTRTNVEAREIIQHLMLHQQKDTEALKFNIISAEALLVSASLCVQLFVAAIKVLNDVSNHFFWAHLIKFAAQIKGENISEDEIYNKTTREKIQEKYLPQSFLNQIENLQKLPILDITEKLIDFFDLNTRNEEFAYILAFQDIVIKFQNDGNNGLNDFIDWWQNEGFKQSVQPSGSMNAIEVMTIHKSKGLAFPIVLLPFADWELVPSKSSNIIWCDNLNSSFNQLPTLPIKFSKELEKSNFAADYYEEMLYAQMDSINLLYVALTRAEKEIVLYAPFKNDGKLELKIAGDLVYQTLQNNDAYPKNEKIPDLTSYFSVENFEFIFETNHESGSDKEKQKSENIVQLQSYHQSEWLDKIVAESELDDIFLPDPNNVQRKVNFGSVMHLLLSKIETEKDIDFQLNALEMKGLIKSEEKNEFKNALLKIINGENTKNWFSGNFEVLSEKGILTKNGKIKRPDKILISEKKIILLDFKFTHEKLASHRSQILEYKELLNEMGYTNIQSNLYYGFTNEVVSF